MRRLTSFWTIVMVGYGIVVLLLASGMLLTARRFDAVATAHVEQIRVQEHEITLAERLRLHAVAIVSTGRGYLISGDPAFLEGLRSAAAEFDAGIQALKQSELTPRGRALVAEIERSATSFRQQQERRITSQPAEDAATRARRFEAELVPLRASLGRSLDALIQHKQAALEEVYDTVARERTDLAARLNGFFGILVAMSFGIAWYVATLLGRLYHQEETALDTARQAVLARDELMGIVAHDLRNPLGAITMRAELIRAGSDPDAMHRQADAIERVAMRMERLIKSMLDVTTIEAGRFTVSPSPCKVEDLLHETTEVFAELAVREQVRLETVAPPNAIVRADRERVLQVLANLVGNAIKFTPKGGVVTLSAERGATSVRFAISDTGPGIAPEHLPHLFDRFWKLEARGKKGTGLGLFIAKGIVQAHGGRIWVESELGHGTTFHVTLPDATLADDPPRA
ncbi:MAG: CHASE3 domain-containing protein [Deltaproteobacteria bacterium]|nr:CHASE3 domain-containing protein [Deltaproteobacteria bacterium]